MESSALENAFGCREPSFYLITRKNNYNFYTIVLVTSSFQSITSMNEEDILSWFSAYRCKCKWYQVNVFNSRYMELVARSSSSTLAYCRRSYSRVTIYNSIAVFNQPITFYSSLRTHINIAEIMQYDSSYCDNFIEAVKVTSVRYIRVLVLHSM